MFYLEKKDLRKNLKDSLKFLADGLLPSNFNISPNKPWQLYSMLNAVAYNGSNIIVVGGEGDNNGTIPIAGLYNSFSNSFTNLPLGSQYNGCGLTAAASNGNQFLVAAICQPNSSAAFNSQYFIYDNGKFSNVSSSINTGKDFAPMSMSYDGSAYMIVGYYPFNGTLLTTSKASGLFSYSVLNGLKNLTNTIPKNMFSNKIFSSVTWDGSQYAIMTLDNNDTVYNGAVSDINLTMYNPASSAFSSYSLPSTVQVNYGNGGIAWDGANFLVINAIPGGFTTGLFNQNTKEYTQLGNTVQGFSGVTGGVPGQGFVWNGYEFFIPGLGPTGNGVSPFLYNYN